MRGRAPEGSPPRRAARRQPCSLREGPLATPALGQPLGGRRGIRPAPSEKWERRKKPSNPHLQKKNGVEGGGKTGRTTQLTCRPRRSLFLQEANPRRSRAALPQPSRGDKDGRPPRARRLLQHRGQRPPRPSALSGDSTPGIAELQYQGQRQRQRHVGPRPRSAAPRASGVKRPRPRRAHVSCGPCGERRAAAELCLFQSLVSFQLLGEVLGSFVGVRGISLRLGLLQGSVWAAVSEVGGCV